MVIGMGMLGSIFICILAFDELFLAIVRGYYQSYN